MLDLLTSDFAQGFALGMFFMVQAHLVISRIYDWCHCST
jgi:hypothetical protein